MTTVVGIYHTGTVIVRQDVCWSCVIIGHITHRAHYAFVIDISELRLASNTIQSYTELGGLQTSN